MKTFFIALIFIVIGIVIGLTVTNQSTIPSSEQVGTVEEQPVTDFQAERVEKPALTEENVVIPTDSLSDEQLQLLDTFGVEGDEIVITPEMMTCAEEKIGQTRVNEIIEGSTPSFLEGVSLARCY